MFFQILIKKRSSSSLSLSSIILSAVSRMDIPQKFQSAVSDVTSSEEQLLLVQTAWSWKAAGAASGLPGALKSASFL